MSSPADTPSASGADTRSAPVTPPPGPRSASRGTPGGFARARTAEEILNDEVDDSDEDVSGEHGGERFDGVAPLAPLAAWDADKSDGRAVGRGGPASAAAGGLAAGGGMAALKAKLARAKTKAKKQVGRDKFSSDVSSLFTTGDEDDGVDDLVAMLQDEGEGASPELDESGKRVEHVAPIPVEWSSGAYHRVYFGDNITIIEEVEHEYTAELDRYSGATLAVHIRAVSRELRERLVDEFQPVRRLRGRVKVYDDGKLTYPDRGFKKPRSAIPPPEEAFLRNFSVRLDYDWSGCDPRVIKLKNLPPHEPGKQAPMAMESTFHERRRDLKRADVPRPAASSLWLQIFARTANWVTLFLQILHCGVVLYQPRVIPADPWDARCDSCSQADFDLFHAAYHILALVVSLPLMSWVIVRFGYYIFDKTWRGADRTSWWQTVRNLSIVWVLCLGLMAVMRFTVESRVNTFLVTFAFEVVAWVAVAAFVGSLFWGNGQHTDHERLVNARSVIPLYEYLVLAGKATDVSTFNIVAKTYRDVALAQLVANDVPMIAILAVSFHRFSDDATVGNTSLQYAALIMTVVMFFMRVIVNLPRIVELLLGGADSIRDVIVAIVLFPYAAYRVMTRQFDRETTDDVDRFNRRHHFPSRKRLKAELLKYCEEQGQGGAAAQTSPAAVEEGSGTPLPAAGMAAVQQMAPTRMLTRKQRDFLKADSHGRDALSRALLLFRIDEPISGRRRFNMFFFRFLFLVNLVSDLLLVFQLAPEKLEDLFSSTTGDRTAALIVIVFCITCAFTLAVPLVCFLQTRSGMTQFLWVGLAGFAGSGAVVFVSLIADPSKFGVLVGINMALIAFACAPALLMIKARRYSLVGHRNRLMASELIAGVAGCLPLSDMVIIASLKRFRTYFFLHRLHAVQERWLFYAQDLPMVVLLIIVLLRDAEDTTTATVVFAGISFLFTIIHLALRGQEIVRWIWFRFPRSFNEFLKRAHIKQAEEKAEALRAAEEEGEAIVY